MCPLEIAMKTSIVFATTSALIVSAQALTLAPISPHRALSYKGQCVMVEGKASVRKDPIRLGTDIDLDGEKSPFLGYIIPGNESQFPSLNSYAGKIVDITGVVQFYQGRAEIRMTSANQINPASPNKGTGGLTHIDPSFVVGGSEFCG
jgi:DNA/RNA endonuclease YhcR with UshA esterase domain